MAGIAASPPSFSRNRGFTPRFRSFRHTRPRWLPYHPTFLPPPARGPRPCHLLGRKLRDGLDHGAPSHVDQLVDRPPRLLDQIDPRQQHLRLHVLTDVVLNVAEKLGAGVDVPDNGNQSVLAEDQGWKRVPTLDANAKLLHSGGEDFFHRRHSPPFRYIAAWRVELLAAVGPDRMGDATKGNQTLVISLLVEVIDTWAGEQSAAVVLVGQRVGHAGVGRAEGLAAIAGLAEEYVRLKALPGGVIASVVKRHIDIAGDRVHGKPVIEAVHGEWQLIGHGCGFGPSVALVVGVGEKNIGSTAGGEVHPGAIEAALIRTAGAVGVAGGIDQRTTKTLRRYADVEGRRFGRDDPLGAKGYPTIKGAVKGNDIGMVVVPGNVKLTIGTNERVRADGLTRAGWGVGADHRKASAVIRRMSHANPTCT